MLLTQTAHEGEGENKKIHTHQIAIATAKNLNLLRFHLLNDQRISCVCVCV